MHLHQPRTYTHSQGPVHSVILSVCQNLNMILTTIGYHIAAADSMRYIAKLLCKVQGKDACPLASQWEHTLIFGAVQVLMSLLPSLERCVRAAQASSALRNCRSIRGLPSGHAHDATSQHPSLTSRPSIIIIDLTDPPTACTSPPKTAPGGRPPWGP
jgi:hypothetical protein